jgi:hypothetical protein
MCAADDTYTLIHDGDGVAHLRLRFALPLRVKGPNRMYGRFDTAQSKV